MTCPHCAFSWQVPEPPTLVQTLVQLRAAIVQLADAQAVQTPVAHRFVDSKSLRTNNSKPSPKAKHQYTEGFELWWKLFPRRENKLRASVQYERAIAAGVDAQVLCNAAQRYADWCRANDIDNNKIKMAEGWLSAARWEDELDLGRSTVLQREDDFEARRRLAYGEE